VQLIFKYEMPPADSGGVTNPSVNNCEKLDVEIVLEFIVDKYGTLVFCNLFRVNGLCCRGTRRFGGEAYVRRIPGHGGGGCAIT
jgi:hypothetical protein